MCSNYQENEIKCYVLNDILFYCGDSIRSEITYFLNQVIVVVSWVILCLCACRYNYGLDDQLLHMCNNMYIALCLV